MESQRAIASCTRFINSGTLNKVQLSEAHYWRGWHTVTDPAAAAKVLADYGEAIRVRLSVSGPERKGAVKFLWQRAFFRAHKSDVKGAFADYAEALKVDPEHSDSYYARGKLHIKVGNVDQAIADFSDAIRVKRDPKKTPYHAYYQRGLAYGKKGDVERAQADFQTVLRALEQGEAVYPFEDISRLTAQNVKEQLAALKRKEMPPAAPAVQAAAPPPASPAPPTSSPAPGPAPTDADVRRDYELAARIGSKEALEAFLTRYSSGYYADLARAQLRTLALGTQVSAAPAPTARTRADPGRRVALVIGNTAYKGVPVLPNPSRDAQAIAGMLRNVGFQSVTVHSDLARDKLIDALRVFARESTNADWAVIYFAGHGIEIGGINYLVPTDARLETDRDVQYEAVALDQVLGSVEGAKKLRLIILDACRDNPFTRQMKRTVASRSIGRGLGRVEPEGGTLVAYAAKHGETALDGGTGENSPFVAALVKHLPTAGMEINKLFRVVRDEVMGATGRKQEPFIYGSLPSDDFYFVAK